MSNDFAVSPEELPLSASVVRDVGESLACLAPPPTPAAGPSTDAIGAAIATVMADVGLHSTELTTVAEALVDAARRYGAVDDVVATSLLAWGR